MAPEEENEQRKFKNSVFILKNDLFLEFRINSFMDFLEFRYFRICIFSCYEEVTV